MDPALRIEPATERDVEVVLRMIKALAAYEKLSDEVVATEHSLRDALFGHRPAAEVVVAYVENKPAGFAVFFQTFSTFLGSPCLYVEDLFVDPGWRGRGFGKQLFAHVAGLAVSRGCKRLEWTVLDWNEAAIRFYRKLGAEPEDEWTGYRLSGEALARLARERHG